MSADLTLRWRAPRSTSPATPSDKLAKALDRGADEVIVDLEDAVAPPAKDARPRDRPGLAARPAGPRQRRRLGAGQPRRAARGRRPRGRRAPALTGFVRRQDRDGRRAGRPRPAARRRSARRRGVVPLLESAARGAAGRASSPRAPRVQRLQVGEADLRADVGVTPGPDERELLLRPLARRARLGRGRHRAADRAGVDELPRPRRVPRTRPQALARLGFVGRACIHPAQVAVANDVFTPTDDEVARARRPARPVGVRRRRGRRRRPTATSSTRPSSARPASSSPAPAEPPLQEEHHDQRSHHRQHQGHRLRARCASSSAAATASSSAAAPRRPSTRRSAS